MTIKKGTSTIATAGASEWGSIEGTLSDQTDLQNALNAKAPTLSPALTGAPTAPTAEQGTNTTQIATTEFVTTALNNIDALPDQTDMAGKYLATDGTDAFWRSPSGLPLLSFLWSDHLLNDASFLRADTFSWQSGLVYTSAYNHLVADISGKPQQTETVGGVTISFILADDGHKIVYDETAVSLIYAATGVAWYYIIDTTNQRFKLPRTKYGFTGLRDNVGNYVEPGLPNITGSTIGDGFNGTNGIFWDNTGSGALSSAYETFDVATVAQYTTNMSTNKVTKLYFDASRSSSIYGNSTTVQPPATQMYLYFYAGNTIRNETEIDVGEITEALDGKLDQDLSNASASFKSTIMGYGLVNWDAGVLKTLDAWNTADSDGFIMGYVFSNVNNDVTINSSVFTFQSGNSSNIYSGAGFYLPVRQGDSFYVSARGATGAANYVAFFPLQGV